VDVDTVDIFWSYVWAVALTTGLLFIQILVPPTFVLNNVTADADVRGVSSTVINEPPNANGAGLLRIPSADWFISVALGPSRNDRMSSIACDIVVFHNASVMRYSPQNICIGVGIQ
jgi:hypothetical protein